MVKKIIYEELFTDKLKESPLFKDNVDSIYPSYAFMEYLLKFKGECNVPCGKIKDIYKPFTDGDYRRYLGALRELDLIKFKDNDFFHYNNGETGKCRTYKLTKTGASLLFNTNLKYFYSGKTIFKTIKKIPIYDNYILNYVQDLHIYLNYNKDQIIKDILNLTEETKRAYSLNKLVLFKNKIFSKLRVSECDGRLFNDFASLPSLIKKSFTYKNLSYVGALDIRCCHPSFFADYLLNKYQEETSQYIHTNIYRGGWGSSRPNLGDNVLDNMCIECIKMRQIFLDPNIDPKEYLSSKTGIDKEKIKKIIIQILNGSPFHQDVLKWLESEFPYLIKFWKITDIKQTGCQISKKYESGIMLNGELYKLADLLGLKLSYEYDGVGIFGDYKDPELLNKIGQVKNKITEISNNLFNIPIVVKYKDSI